MIRILLIALCLFAIIGAAAAQQPPASSAKPDMSGQPPSQPPADNPGASMGERSGAAALLNVTPSTDEFVKDVATSDLFEIAESRLAASQGGPQSKKFATRMLADHQKTTTELTALLSSANVGTTPPTDLDSAHQAKIDQLKQIQGEDFDKRYGADQITAHKDAVSLFQRYAKGGDNKALKEWAAKTLPTLQSHLKMAESLPH